MALKTLKCHVVIKKILFLAAGEAEAALGKTFARIRSLRFLEVLIGKSNNKVPLLWVPWVPLGSPLGFFGFLWVLLGSFGFLKVPYGPLRLIGITFAIALPAAWDWMGIQSCLSRSMIFKGWNLGKIWFFHDFWKSSVVSQTQKWFSYQYGENWGKISSWHTIYRYSSYWMQRDQNPIYSNT